MQLLGTAIDGPISKETKARADARERQPHRLLGGATGPD